MRVRIMRTQLHQVLLVPGSRLGPFEVISLLGPGGWARSIGRAITRLGRDVALKVLPAAWVSRTAIACAALRTKRGLQPR